MSIKMGRLILIEKFNFPLLHLVLLSPHTTFLVIGCEQCRAIFEHTSLTQFISKVSK